MKSYQAFKEKYQLKLNPQQEKALLQKEGQVLLLAVPGSGKTTVIINRIAYLMMVEKIKAENILTLTFSRMGARDLKDRYQKSFGSQEKNLQFSTIHSFSLSVIRYYERQYQRRAFDILANVSPLIRKLYRQIFNAYVGENELNEIIQRIGYVKNMMVSKEDIDKMPALEIDFPKLLQAYDTYKEENALMDFDDLLKYTYGLLKRHPSMLEEFKSRYSYIHLDEAQDTSKIQFKIIELLVGDKGNFFVVGDEDQSIYGFRGAYPEFLLAFNKRWEEGQILFMESNYRSSQEIVSKANAFIKLNDERYDKKMVSVNGPGIPIVREIVKTPEQQYRFIIESILREGKETAVLYRNNESAIPLVDLFDREGIPYLIKEHNSAFFNHFILKDIEKFYHFANKQEDASLFEEIYYKMDLALSKEMMQRVASQKKLNESALKAMIRLNKDKPWLKKSLDKAQKDFNILRGTGPQAGIEIILDRLGYREYLNFRISSGQSEERIEQKLSVLNILARRVDTFPAYFDYLEALNEKLKQTQIHSGKKPRVTLSTFHSSKGLEFEKVFIIDASEGQIPSTGSKENQALYSEEVRLFYVAITRAKSQLIFLVVKNKEKGIFPSPFITYLIEGIPKKKRFKQEKKEVRTKDENFFPKKKNDCLKDQAKELDNYQVGKLVVHRRFGQGQILEKKGVVINVRFENVGDKKMNLAVCLENGVIKV